MEEISDAEHAINMKEYNRLSEVVDGFFVRTNSQIEYLISSGKEYMKFYTNYRRGNKLNKDTMKQKFQAIEKIILLDMEPDPSIFYSIIQINTANKEHHDLHDAIINLTREAADFLSRESERLPPKEFYKHSIIEIGKTILAMEILVDEFELHFNEVVKINDKFKIDFPEEVKKYWP
jgi:hypothetical protein